ncbi:M14 metallopeptidase family protein [Muricauda sp. MAR_2010_75]|uniref:M14 family metallopeptidase n=1 Tax=Allomuricauda sp. MAR_2010_75 TaxID=1250232 RepID=UPI00055BDE83|nr:M14 metallopeptidase family protein [Muricauda sp. MAR_2010_75]
MIAHSLYKEASIQNRYITHDMLQKCFAELPASSIEEIGQSVLKVPIHSFILGHGSKHILMWSQMHGNESTTTKAVWDMANFLRSNDPLAKAILENCTLMVVPMLNPDGAKAYTRVNANAVDLNRDAKQLTQPESVALRKLFEDFKPDYCFNLHGQRTLFSAGQVEKPATVSFLSPSSNAARDITPTRVKAMKLIAAMNAMLQKLIPGQVGRYDDGFNDNCVGDSFQMLGVPTVLFEAGHYPNDYEREQTRKYIFLALIEALKTASTDSLGQFSTGDYFNIPANGKLFYDILVKNPQVLNPALSGGSAIGIRFKEILENDIIRFKPEIIDVGNLNGFFGHQTFKCADSMDFEAVKSNRELYELLLQAEE